MTQLPRVSTDELAALREIVAEHAPELLPAVSEIEARKLISNEQAEQLEELVSTEMLADYSEEDGLSERGLVLDDVVGKIVQYAPRYWSPS